MKKRMAFLVLIPALAATAFVAFRYFKDPEGHSRRHPQSMHAHQSEWPKQCQFREGSAQSPIAVSSSVFLDKPIEPTRLTLSLAPAELIDVGHTFQVRYTKAHGGEIYFNGQKYELRQFHFHKPSEHLVDGKQFEMEAHFVFLPTILGPSKALVLGFPIVTGEGNPELAKAWRHLPPYREGYGEVPHEALDWQNAAGTHELELKDLTHHEKLLADSLTIDVARLIPEKINFFVYEGSLTTPSCDEGVTHAVSLTPMVLGHEQIEHFEGYYEGTNRDLQPINRIASRRFRRAEVIVQR